LLATFDSASSPDIVLLYDENTITTSPYYQKIGRKGDHGGASWGAQHIPLVLMGPGIRQAYRSDYPARLVDIAPTVETLLGIAPQHQDGVPLADSMLHPPSWARNEQSGVGARLTGDVRALEQEANLRPNLGP
jgi:arylsulfatase A-like enzyme